MVWLALNRCRSATKGVKNSHEWEIRPYLILEETKEDNWLWQLTRRTIKITTKNKTTHSNCLKWNNGSHKIRWDPIKTWIQEGWGSICLDSMTSMYKLRPEWSSSFFDRDFQSAGPLLLHLPCLLHHIPLTDPSMGPLLLYMGVVCI